MAETRQEIKEFAGLIEGYIITKDNGQKWGQVFAGPYVGIYDPVTNTTREWGGRYICNGDILASLIRDEFRKTHPGRG